MKALIAASVVLLGLFAQEQADPKYKVTPTGDPTAPFKVYVPKDLEDAFVELRRMLHPHFVDDLKKGGEKDAVMHHHGLGLWMRNNWALWAGSRLSEWFNERRIYHPDDMSGIILKSFVRRLNNEPINLSEQIRHYREYWASSAIGGAFECPWDESTVTSRFSVPGKTPDGLNAPIFAGRCEKSRHLWAGQFERAPFRPVGALLAALKAEEKKAPRQ